MTEVCLVKLLLDVARRVRLEVDSNKTDKNWSTYQSSRPLQRDFGVLIGLEWKWQQDKALHFPLKKEQTNKEFIREY